MLLDEYPPGPCLIVGNRDAEPVAIVAIRWPHGLIDALAVFTLSDTARVELVVPAWIRPAQGDGSVCPCGGDETCGGCGGTGIFRGVENAIVVYPLTPDGAGECVTYPQGKELKMVGGMVPRCFAIALAKRKENPEPVPVDLVLDALSVQPDMKVRML